QLRTEIATVERQRGDLGAAEGRGESSADRLGADLQKIRAWYGRTGLVGAGVTITIQGPIGSDGVQDLLNELRNAGAEGIAIGDRRFVPALVVVGGPGSLVVAGQPLGTVFEIRAVGSPPVLTGTLTRAGGVIAQLP